MNREISFWIGKTGFPDETFSWSILVNNRRNLWVSITFLERTFRTFCWGAVKRCPSPLLPQISLTPFWPDEQTGFFLSRSKICSFCSCYFTGQPLVPASGCLDARELDLQASTHLLAPWPLAWVCRASSSPVTVSGVLQDRTSGPFNLWCQPTSPF